jgi:hypothetical protein
MKKLKPAARVLDYFNGPDWIPCVQKIYTALTGRLCFIVERDGEWFAETTDIPVAVPPCVRRTAQLAAGINIDESERI